MVREKWRSMLASCCHGSNYVPDKRLGQLLQQWGGDEEEGVHLAEKEAGDKERRLKVLGEDLTAEELKEVLQVGPLPCPCLLPFAVQCECGSALPRCCAALSHSRRFLVCEAVDTSCSCLYRCVVTGYIVWGATGTGCSKHPSKALTA